MDTIPITFNQIRYVLAVAEEGSTAAAARRLNISQPSISLAISRFEDELGHPLFARRPGQGMEPTRAGARKLSELRLAYRQMAEVFSDPAGEAGPGAELALGFLTTLGPRYVPGLVRRFQDTGSRARVRLLEGDLKSLMDWLRSGRIELALLYDFALPSDLDITVLKEIRPYGLVWPGHPLAGRSGVTVAELMEDPLILINLPASRDFFLSLLQGQEVPVRIAFETASVEMLRTGVANRLGVGLLATDLPYDTTYDGKRIVRVPLTGPMPPHRVALARNPQLPPGRAAQAFADLCTQELSGAGPV